MASVDTVSEWREAEALGWRVFLVVPKGAMRVVDCMRIPWEDDPPRELLLCPATRQKARGAAITCADCLLCNGTRGKARSIWEKIHGAGQENMSWAER